MIKNSFLELTRTYWNLVGICLKLRWHRKTLIKFHYFHQFHLREDAIECNFHDSFPLNEISFQLWVSSKLNLHARSLDCGIGIDWWVVQENESRIMRLADWPFVYFLKLRISRWISCNFNCTMRQSSLWRVNRSQLKNHYTTIFNFPTQV